MAAKVGIRGLLRKSVSAVKIHERGDGRGGKAEEVVETNCRGFRELFLPTLQYQL
jgi:hypothetical protein